MSAAALWAWKETSPVLHSRAVRVRLFLVVLSAAAGATCGGNKLPTDQPPPGVAAVAAAGGDAQTGPVAQPLPTPLAVLVTDSTGAGVPGVTVRWTTAQGSGSVSAGSSTTDASGLATVTWTLGDVVGAMSASAAVTGLPPVTFQATASAGSAAKLVFSAQPSGVTAGAVFSPPVQVSVQDAHGNAVDAPPVSIALAVATGTGTAGAHLRGTATATTSGGVATFAAINIDSAGTGYRLRATAAGLTGATSDAFNVLAGTAAVAAVQAGNGQTAAPGAAVAIPPAVIVKDGFGNVKPGASVTFAVASGGGTITGGSQTTNASGIAAVGSWTLGSAGTNTLTATVSGSGITGNPVTFTATATGSGGGTVLFQEDFENANLGSRGWYDLPSGGIQSITTTEHIPGSTASLQINFNQGGVTPSPPVATRHLFTASNTVYLRYWVKYSSNWVGSGHSYHPHEFYFLTSEDPQYVGPAYTHLTVYVETNYQNGGYAVLSTQDAVNIDATRVNQDLTGVTESRAVSGCNGNSDGTSTTCYQDAGKWYNGKTWKSAQAVFQPNPGAGYKGDWHQVEVYFQLNSIQNGIGQLDGVAQYWFDGQLVIDRHNVLFRTGAHPTMQFNQFLIGPYIGDGSPVAQQMWVDNLIVMTARP
jgi:hypothetical protein